MSQYPHAHFILSANSPRQFPPDEGGEVAFAGRSNAGKSSAINALVNRRQFARTSKTPGRTQLLNFFALGEGTRIVDLPGYGFARVTAAIRDHWGQLLGSYFELRRSLLGLFLIVDIRRGLTDFDRQLLALADSRDLPVHVLLTKADKLKRGQASAALLAARRELGARATVQLFSATRREGVDEARAALDACLAGPEAGGAVE
ncbi:MAG: ribosome biogenesis GTP-binding protein YihA/YsxC [Gammaproteobacteria bacterium]|nr:ribosome biogenesis GTP-binding protein YihA/YsxC [Gammaproteobacteria bacterium]MDH4255866.1 ribosome biogenesis GTP-binding protein YihA/YsxC [Gammaproteobacteria bacterium]MDH5310648.1 ribosome biogenesis GTP-binding protein YihA/YsxC [Gammaproteobacteria bacterium]